MTWFQSLLVVIGLIVFVCVGSGYIGFRINQFIDSLKLSPEPSADEHEDSYRDRA